MSYSKTVIMSLAVLLFSLSPPGHTLVDRFGGDQNGARVAQ